MKAKQLEEMSKIDDTINALKKDKIQLMQEMEQKVNQLEKAESYQEELLEQIKTLEKDQIMMSQQNDETQKAQLTRMANLMDQAKQVPRLEGQI